MNTVYVRTTQYQRFKAMYISDKIGQNVKKISVILLSLAIYLVKLWTITIIHLHNAYNYLLYMKIYTLTYLLDELPTLNYGPWEGKWRLICFIFLPFPIHTHGHWNNITNQIKRKYDRYFFFFFAFRYICCILLNIVSKSYLPLWKYYKYGSM